ncbi:hypothetical protein M404DRAFT_1007387 [Pisolithus tinctorius Marx 270]|uniref:Uncharacterized protein n=1 Tax=Pisolithus tinctorius Marx 270 TaxID=870435 RepID=A0A0C3NJG7_PISTI|nr:hypothetical protein M404DRAFT_1007387 [Pisolithus tinctorius Marx 270]
MRLHNAFFKKPLSLGSNSMSPRLKGYLRGSPTWRLMRPPSRGILVNGQDQARINTKVRHAIHNRRDEEPVDKV